MRGTSYMTWELTHFSTRAPSPTLTYSMPFLRVVGAYLKHNVPQIAR